MKRRNFLGFLAGGVAAGPGLARSAASMSLADVNLRQQGLASSLSGGIGAAGQAATAVEAASHGSWAAGALKRLLDRSPAEIDRLKRETYVDGLDAQVASLRSVALHKKVSMTKTLAFEQRERAERGYLEGVIAGLWK